MTNRMIRTLMAGASLIAATAAPSAHHNMSAAFDFDQRFTRVGPLTKVDWRNPHIYLWLDVKNDQGQIEKWSFEGPAPNFFLSRSIKRTDFENAIGKTVTMEASRARDGSLSGLIRIVKLPDGKEISLCPQNC